MLFGAIPVIPMHKKERFRIITEKQDIRSMHIWHPPKLIKHKADESTIIFEEETYIYGSHTSLTNWIDDNVSGLLVSI
jgi:hypothetical protein